MLAVIVVFSQPADTELPADLCFRQVDTIVAGIPRVGYAISRIPPVFNIRAAIGRNVDRILNAVTIFHTVIAHLEQPGGELSTDPNRG